MTVYFSEIVEHPLKSIAAVFRVASGYSRLDRLDPDSRDDALGNSEDDAAIIPGFYGAMTTAAMLMAALL